MIKSRKTNVNIFLIQKYSINLQPERITLLPQKENK